MQTLTAGGKIFNLYGITGKVVSQGKYSTTSVSGGGGGGGGPYGERVEPVTITSTTTVHNDIVLADSNGKEHAFSLSDFGIICREGHELSVIWAIRQGRQQGPYIVVINRTTSEQYWCSDKTLTNTFFMRWYHFLLIPWVVIMCFALVFATGCGLGLLILAAPLFFLTIKQTGSGRRTRFKSEFKFEDTKPA